MSAQIQAYHHQKLAYIYLRQSTLGQVRHHQESTARQYALKDKALSWMNRFRSVLIRWAKKTENYLGLLHFVCGLIAYRVAGLFG
jgi:hypothetical protein